jgi:multidrug efflux system membrane fusion protein
MRANFENPKGVLFPNQFVNVQLLIDTETGVVLAPNPAIQIGASGSFVYAIGADSKVAKQDVVTGPTDGKRTAIVSGLQAGENLVIDGADRLRDGAAVTIVDNSGASAPPGGQGGHSRQGQGVAPDGAGASDGRGRHRHARRGGAPGGGNAAAQGAQQ